MAKAKPAADPRNLESIQQRARDAAKKNPPKRGTDPRVAGLAGTRRQPGSSRIIGGGTGSHGGAHTGGT